VSVITCGERRRPIHESGVRLRTGVASNKVQRDGSRRCSTFSPFTQLSNARVHQE
jgi:hypothetical protein